MHDHFIKKSIVLISCFWLLLTGCNGKSGAVSSPETITSDPAVPASALPDSELTWIVNSNLSGRKSTLPANAQNAFENDAEELTTTEGDSPVPVMLLGAQIVNGTNYEILAYLHDSYGNPMDSLLVLTIYEDLEGNVSLTSRETLKLADIADTSHVVSLSDKDGLDGNYTIVDSVDDHTGITIQFEVEGNHYVSCFTSQVSLGQAVTDDGENIEFAILALETRLDEDGNPAEQLWAVITINANADDISAKLTENSQIRSVYEFGPGDLTEQLQSMED